MEDLKRNILVSVIIPTLNRRKTLIETLEGFRSQSYQDFEIIIVDQSSNPITSREVPFLDEKLKIFPVSFKGSHKARNYGVKKAKGEILIFVDDDVLIKERNFLKNHVKHYQNSQIGAVVGRVIQPWEEEDKPTLKVGNISKNLLIVKGGFNSREAQYTRGLIGCNFSTRKKIFLKLEGFDENFKGTAYFEETDFGLRLIQEGWKILFEPKAKLKHLAYQRGGVREAASEQTTQFYWFFYNYIYLFSKHGNRYLWPLFGIYLLGRGIFYVIKYRNIKIFTYSCLKGIYNGLLRK